MTDAELEALDKWLVSRANGRPTSAHPFPMPSADAPSAPRTSLTRSHVPAPTKMLAATTSTKRPTKALSKEMRERKRQTSLLRRLKKKSAKNVNSPSGDASPDTRHTPAPTVFPFFPKRAPTQAPATHALATHGTQTLTQSAPTLTALLTQASPPPPPPPPPPSLAPPSLAVVAPALAPPSHAALAPIDFAASLTSVTLSFNLASMSLAQGVEMVAFIYGRLFEHQYSLTMNDRMLYSANLWAVEKMAHEMGTEAQATTFAHWQQIAHSLIDQICTLV